MPPTTLLHARNLAVGYERALSSVTLSIQAGEIIRIKGRNGAGKTTLLRTLLGYMPPISGTIDRSLQWRIGDTVSYLPQGANETLLWWLDVRQNVQMGLLNATSIHVRPEFDELAQSFDRLDVSTNTVVSDTRPMVATDLRKLSGGQRQRIAILRALIVSATLFVMDEPFQELDASATEALCRFLENVTRQHRTACMVVTHQEVPLVYSREIAVA